MDTWRDTLMSQFATSPTLVQMVSNMNDYLDTARVSDEFYDVVWNIDTAEGFGLDIWGRILNISRVVQIPNPAIGDFFGFAQSFDAEPMNQAPFYNATVTTEGLSINYSLDDDDYRILLLAKAFSNISDGSVPSINAILMSLFGTSGDCWVDDRLDMSMAYQFDFTPTDIQLAIIFQSGVLPVPAGVFVAS